MECPLLLCQHYAWVSKGLWKCQQPDPGTHTSCWHRQPRALLTSGATLFRFQNSGHVRLCSEKTPPVPPKSVLVQTCGSGLLILADILSYGWPRAVASWQSSTIGWATEEAQCVELTWANTWLQSLRVWRSWRLRQAEKARIWVPCIEWGWCWCHSQPVLACE